MERPQLKSAAVLSVAHYGCTTQYGQMRCAQYAIHSLLGHKKGIDPLGEAESPSADYAKNRYARMCRTVPCQPAVHTTPYTEAGEL